MAHDLSINMTESSRRITNPVQPPTDAEVAAWIGKNACRYWTQLVQGIEERYPGIFKPAWLYGGKKHGWSLRYKKSKSFCTLIPEKNRFALVIVFGASERAKVEAVSQMLSVSTRKAYDGATTYSDGKWLYLIVDNKRVMDDVLTLLAVKRKPASRLEA